MHIGWVWYRHRKVEKMLWITLAIIVIFGGATLLLHNESFIKWKPTVLYWVFAVTLLISEFRFHKNLIRSMMTKRMSLPDHIWRKLLLSWASFFVVMGTLNLYVAFNFSTGAWVNYKLFGSIGLMIVFGFLQALMLGKYMDPDSKTS
jgi:intracellular septation protein